MTSGTVLSLDKFPYRWTNSIQYGGVRVEKSMWNSHELFEGLKTRRFIHQPILA